MTLVEQLRDMHRASGLSVQALLDKSKLKIDRSSLARKLSGDLRTTLEEAMALVDAMGGRLVWPHPIRRR